LGFEKDEDGSVGEGEGDIEMEGEQVLTPGTKTTLLEYTII
jgi:hypothetical protein